MGAGLTRWTKPLSLHRGEWTNFYYAVTALSSGIITSRVIIGALRGSHHLLRTAEYGNNSAWRAPKVNPGLARRRRFPPPIFASFLDVRKRPGQECPAHGRSAFLELLEQVAFELLLPARSQLLAVGGEIEGINGHLAFGVDQRDFNVAVLVRKTRRDAME